MQISFAQKFNSTWWEWGKSYRCGRFVIDEIFLYDNKKELQNAPKQKKRSTRSDGGEEALKEQKHSWCSKLPSFFIFLCDAHTNLIPRTCHHHQQNKEFLQFFRPSSGTFPFHLFFCFLFLPTLRCVLACLSLPCYKYTKAQSTLRKLRKVLLEKEKECEGEREKRTNRTKKCATEKLSSTDSGCVWIPFAVPCALSLLMMAVWVYWTFYLPKKQLHEKYAEALNLGYSRQAGEKGGSGSECGHHYPFT
jgi:hypothetical protein